MVHVGKVVRWLRERAGKTLVEVAAESHVSKTTLSGLERGKNFKRETLLKIAPVIGTTEADIYRLHTELQSGVRHEIVNQLDTPKGALKPHENDADTDEAPGHETLTGQAGRIMATYIEDPKVQSAVGEFRQLSPEQQDLAIGYMRDLRMGVVHPPRGRQAGKRRG